MKSRWLHVGEQVQRLSLATVVVILVGSLTVIIGEQIVGGSTPLPLIVSPAPGTRTASATTQISLLGSAAQHLSSIEVVGSSSGRHDGALKRFTSEPGASFVMGHPFVAGERVTVHVGVAVVGAPSGTYSFVIAHRIEVTPPNGVPTPDTAATGVSHFASAPNLDPPVVSVVSLPKGDDGDLFLTPKGSSGNAGPMILARNGTLIWFEPLRGLRAFDLNVQHLGAEPVLTWWQGVNVDAHGAGEDIIANRSYQTIDVIRGGNGFQPDLHEFQLLANGIALVTSYQAIRWNLSPDGGSSMGTVWDSIVQEIDVRTGLVVYEWHSLDHVGVQQSNFKAPHASSTVFDYFHVNSIQQLSNGDLLISARDTSAIYEVSPGRGGGIVWQLGGKNSTFTMGAGTTFWYQHDARSLGNNEISLFDDEATPDRASESRGLVLRLDPANKSVSLVHVYLPPTRLLGAALGNTETLPNGNVLVSWGTTPDFTEYSSAGSIVLRGLLPRGDDTYRVYQSPWEGAPVTLPSVTATRLDGTTVIEVSWNGATSVARWRVVAESGHPRTLATVRKTGFETEIKLRMTSGTFKVQGLNTTGKVIGASAMTTFPSAK